MNFIKKVADTKKTIGILGAAYKPDIDDARESPAIEIINELKTVGYHVIVHDPYVQQFPYPIEKNLNQVIDFADVIVIVTNHKEYYHLPELHTKIVIDTRNIHQERSYLLGRDF